VYDQGAGDGTVYLAMEYIPGRTLRDLVAAAAPLTLGDALDLIEEVLDGLAAAHDAGLVHRDVKPENVLVGDDGRLRVADFGLARAATTATGGATSTLIGTVGYLAPELVLDGASDERADVYAAGVVLYELLTGRAPFAGGAPAQVAYRHVSQDLPLVSRVRPGVPEGVDALVASATDREPDRRPRDAGVMLDLVRDLRDGLPDDVLDAPAVVVPDPATVPVTVDGTRVHEREHIVALPVSELRDAAAAGPAAPLTTPTAALTGSDPAEASQDAPLTRSQTRAVRRSSGPLGLPADAEETEGGGGRRSRSHRLLLLLAVLVALLLTLGAGAVWAYTAGPLAQVVVPRVTPGTAERATQALEAAGFEVEQRPDFSDTVAEGDVIATEPAAGESVAKDSTVTLVVSDGVRYIPVPDLTGKTQAQAEELITGADLEVGRVGQAYSETVPVGSVVSQQTPVAPPLKAGSEVAFTVSQGPKQIPAPVLKGRTLDEATQALEDVELELGDVKRTNDDTVPAGEVISSSPSTGNLGVGDRVAVVVSDGPAMVTVPNLVDRSVDDARGTLEGLGLEVVVQRTWIVGDRVQGQDVPGDSKVLPGTKVTLYVGP
jgi:serine/threonine-protein kinase